MQDILIIGGGFAGVWSALGASAARRELRRAGADVRITLVTPEPYLTIRPRLYEPDPVALRVPLPDLLDAIGVELVLGQSTRIDTSTRTVVVNSAAGHTTHSYDRLILALGITFQLPTLVLFLARMGMVTPRFMIRNFKYAVLLIIIAAAVLSPDGGGVGLIAMGGPVILLYVFSIGLAWAFGRKKKIEA